MMTVQFNWFMSFHSIPQLTNQFKVVWCFGIYFWHEFIGLLVFEITRKIKIYIVSFGKKVMREHQFILLKTEWLVDDLWKLHLSIWFENFACLTEKSKSRLSMIMKKTTNQKFFFLMPSPPPLTINLKCWTNHSLIRRRRRRKNFAVCYPTKRTIEKLLISTINGYTKFEKLCIP